MLLSDCGIRIADWGISELVEIVYTGKNNYISRLGILSRILTLFTLHPVLVFFHMASASLEAAATR